MNLFLIGFRCSGKTVVGRRLAATLHRPFVDTDHLVVQRAGQNIAGIVQEHGWQAFRDMECRVIQDVCQKDRQVVATGGGVILDPRNRSAMTSSGMVVWLKVRPETVLERMQNDPETRGSRPALTGKSPAEEIEETLAQREGLYRKAMDAGIQTDHLPIAEICRRISRFLKTGRPVHT